MLHAVQGSSGCRQRADDSSVEESVNDMHWSADCQNNNKSAVFTDLHGMFRGMYWRPLHAALHVQMTGACKKPSANKSRQATQDAGYL